jgi:hypothetical protein
VSSPRGHGRVRLQTGSAFPRRAAVRTRAARRGPPTGVLPAGLTVVQVGDLIHRGPDSDGVVALVDRYLHDQPDQWIQIVGNHEALYLRDPVFHWPERVGGETAATLQRWWADGSMRVAAALPTPVGDYLVTHAGLTAGFWRAVLATPITATGAAAALNALIGSRDSAVFRTGAMLGRRVSSSAGPLWAEASGELVPSWFQTRMPFGQIHGHSSITDWSTGTLRGSDAVAAQTMVNPVARHETTTLLGGHIIGVDPHHGVDPAPVWAAWEARLIAPVST